MSDERLAQLLAMDDPPARDSAFTLAVLERVAAARARQALGLRLAMLAGLGLSAAALAPTIAALAAEAGQGLEMAALAGAALLAAFGLARTLRSVLAGA